MIMGASEGRKWAHSLGQPLLIASCASDEHESIPVEAQTCSAVGRSDQILWCLVRTRPLVAKFLKLRLCRPAFLVKTQNPSLCMMWKTWD
jgi:hypothetical protein